MIGVGVGVNQTRKLSDPCGLRPTVAGRIAVYDPSVLTSLFQDNLGATPVTALGQSVGRLSDRAGNGLHAVQATPANRPLYARRPVGGRRNMLLNTGTSGAVVGVVGSGGAFPTSVDGSASLTRNIVALGVTGGVPHYDVRITGTLTGGFFINLATTTGVPAVAGQTWVASASVQVVGASSGVSDIILVPSTRLAGGTLKHPYPSGTIGLPGSFTRFQAPAATLSNADGAAGDVAFLLPYLRLACTGTVDITLRIGGAQAEVGAALTAYQLVNTTADITEAGRGDRFALLNDLTNDALAVTLPAATYTVASGSQTGITITAGVVHAGGAYTIPGPMLLYGGVIIDRALTDTETALVTAWLNARRQ